MGVLGRPHGCAGRVAKGRELVCNMWARKLGGGVRASPRQRCFLTKKGGSPSGGVLDTPPRRAWSVGHVWGHNGWTCTGVRHVGASVRNLGT